jgi:hypothetical protein
MPVVVMANDGPDTIIAKIENATRLIFFSPFSLVSYQSKPRCLSKLGQAKTRLPSVEAILPRNKGNIPAFLLKD